MRICRQLFLLVALLPLLACNRQPSTRLTQPGSRPYNLPRVTHDEQGRDKVVDVDGELFALCSDGHWWRLRGENADAMLLPVEQITAEGQVESLKQALFQLYHPEEKEYGSR